MTFLIAEDSARMRASIKHFLSTTVPNHHTILEAADGAEAIALYERKHPDWVLMDIMMEPMDGLAASRNLMEAHPEAKIIILTSYNDDRYRTAAREAGVRAYILKENLRDLTAIVAKETTDLPTG